MRHLRMSLIAALVLAGGLAFLPSLALAVEAQEQQQQPTQEKPKHHKEHSKQKHHHKKNKENATKQS